MKGFFHKIASLALAGLVLLSTLSFTVDMHYCGDRLMDVAFFQKAKSCGMEAMWNAGDCSAQLAKKSCCSDKTWSVKGQETLKDAPAKLTNAQQIFIAAFTYAYIGLFKVSDRTPPSFNGHAPPPPDDDLLVRYQTFLI